MDELINQVTQRAGISTDQAKAAVETVLGFLKDKLPAPVAAQLDSVLGGKGPDLGGLAGGLGGMFGRK
jgi:uncharacterized protein (DUF2267 family)